MMDEFMDLHTHVLPGVDDGSKDMDMTKSMLEACYEQGVRTILATSHNYPGKKLQDNAERLALTQKVNELAKSIAKDLTVLPGNEVFYRKNILEDIEQGHVLTLNQSDYILVEFHPREQFRTIREGLSELIEHGYLPIVAHVERVDEIFYDDSHIRELLKLGVYFQANMEDFMGGIFDKDAKRLRRMLMDKQIHFFGSDCHDTKERKPLMKDCIEYLIKKTSKEAVERVTIRNRDRFLENKYLK